MLDFWVFTTAVLDDSETGYDVRIYYGLVSAGAVATGKRSSAVRLSGEIYLLSSSPLSPADLPTRFSPAAPRISWRSCPPYSSA
jgi:hypothetical protein